MRFWKRKLRMGMVGGGQKAFIGGVHRIAAAMDGQIELVSGCFSRDYKNTLQTGKELYLDPSRCYATYPEMSKSESRLPADKRIDFVSIVTPNVSHYDIAKTFLESGFHVICDKPMTYSLEQAEKLVKLVEKTKLVFALTHNYTGYPLVRHARELFQSGKMGVIRKVIVEYLQDWLMTSVEKTGQKQASWRLDPRQAGIAGAVGDIGTHAESLLEYITGDPITELCADLSGFVAGRKLDDDANILIRLKNGGKGYITASQIATGEENNLRIRIYGSKGAISWAQENPNYMEVSHYQEPRRTLSRGHVEYLSDCAINCTRIPSGHPEGYLEAFANMYCAAAFAIRHHIDGKPLKIKDYNFPTVYDGLRGMKFIYKTVESHRKGSRWIKV